MACTETTPGVLVTIGFYSRRFTPPELRLTIFVRELLAITSSLYHFRFDIGNMPTTVYCDNQSLVAVLSTDAERPLTRRVLSIMSAFGNFNLTFRHVKGIDNPISDLLSRVVPPEDDEFKRATSALLAAPEIELPVTTSTTTTMTTTSSASSASIDMAPFLDLIRSNYEDDDRCKQIIEDLRDDTHPLAARFHMEDGLLFCQPCSQPASAPRHPLR